MTNLTLTKLRYCPYCGKKLQDLNQSQLNFCCFCGTPLINVEKSINAKRKCTICHKTINLNNQNIIECSFCGSPYHKTCISSWLLKYNSCPLCLNVYLQPIETINDK